MTRSPNFPEVSVIMPVFNSADTIGEAVRSLQKQTYRDWELIIVDDGSSDGFLKNVFSEIDSWRVRIHRQENKGVSAARNKALEIASGNYIAFLDADDLWRRYKLAEQIKFLHEHSAENLGLIHGNYVEFNRRREYSPRPLKHVKKSEIYGYAHDNLAIHNFIGLLTVMTPKSVLEEVGGFDESILAASDWDLWLRIAEKYPIGYINQPLAAYRLNPRGVSKNYEKYEKELWKVLKRHLLESDLPDSRKKLGLWLFHRHMAHGFARGRNFSNSIRSFLKACAVRPLAAGNPASLAYMALQFLSGALTPKPKKQ